MSELVTTEIEDSIAMITMDDGKVNALSPRMQRAIHAALDQAEAAGAVVVVAGREGRFSGGFDLAVLTAGGADAAGMVRGGFEIAARLLSFPRPVVVACTGHAIAMGAFLLLAGDHRIGAAGAHRIVANEVAIGLTLPRAAIAICRERLNPAVFTRATLLAEPFSPEEAVAAGFLDRAVPAAEVRATAKSVAAGLAKLDMTAHAASKLRARAEFLASFRAAIEADDADLRRLIAA
ncbi:MAG: crotonase/enoyl-CoA hydratase family protein [Candidatus Binatia bacterium]